MLGWNYEFLSVVHSERGLNCLAGAGGLDGTDAAIINNTDSKDVQHEI